MRKDIYSVTAAALIGVGIWAYKRSTARKQNPFRNLNYLSPDENTLLKAYLKEKGMTLAEVIVFPKGLPQFSNRYESQFKLDRDENGNEFVWNSTEQYMQYHKIAYVDRDQLSARERDSLLKLRRRIALAKDANAAVNMTRENVFSGKTLNDVLKPEWFSRARKSVLLAANKAKFSQNEALLSLLLATGDKTIIAVSTNPRVHTWSIAKEKGQFGLNWAGEIIMQSRDFIRQNQNNHTAVL